jgi:hypothetical protein
MWVALTIRRSAGTRGIANGMEGRGIEHQGFAASLGVQLEMKKKVVPLSLIIGKPSATAARSLSPKQS